MIQLLTSFLAGGCAIAFLTFLAERAPSRIAGVIVSFPVAMVIGLFFVGWTLSPEAVAEVWPVIPIAEGITLMFVVVYVYIALLPLPKCLSIVVSFLCATCVWLALTIPLAVTQFSDLAISFLGFCILVLVAYYFLTIRPQHKEESASILTYTAAQKIGRAIFVGCLMMLIVFISKTLGSFWGGIFSVFPAAYSSTLLILHWQYDAHFLFRMCKMIPIGSLPILVYGFAAAHTFPLYGIVLGTVIAYLISALVFVALLRVLHFVHHYSSEKN